MSNINSFLDFKKINVNISSLYTQASIWQAWYEGKTPITTRSSVQNDKASRASSRRTLGMANQSAKDIATYCIDNYTEISADEEIRAFFQGTDKELSGGLLGKQDFWARIVENIEHGFAVGTAIAYIDERKTVNFLPYSAFMPTKWDINGKTIECVISGKMPNNAGQMVDSYAYFYLDDKKEYVVEYYIDHPKKDAKNEHAFVLRYTWYTRTDVPMFAVFTPNITRKGAFMGKPLGMSILHDSLGLLESIDRLYNTINGDIEVSGIRLIVPEELLDRQRLNADGTVSAQTYIDRDINQLFITKGEYSKTMGNFTIHDHNPQVQFAQQSALMDNFLALLGYKAGFGQDFYTFAGGDGGAVQTATAIVSSNSKLMQTIGLHRIKIEAYLLSIFRAMLAIDGQNKVLKLQDFLHNPKYQLSITFNDSMFIDHAALEERDAQRVTQGLLDLETYIKKHVLPNASQDEIDEMKAKIMQERSLFSYHQEGV